MLDTHEPMFILAVYFPSSKHTLVGLRETLDSQGITLILEDFSGALGYLGGDSISSESNATGELKNEFFNYFNLFTVNLINIIYSSPLDTFYSEDGLFLSAIDLIVVPRSLL